MIVNKKRKQYQYLTLSGGGDLFRIRVPTEVNLGWVHLGRRKQNRLGYWGFNSTEQNDSSEKNDCSS